MINCFLWSSTLKLSCFLNKTNKKILKNEILKFFFAPFKKNLFDLSVNNSFFFFWPNLMKTINIDWFRCCFIKIYELFIKESEFAIDDNLLNMKTHYIIWNNINVLIYFGCISWILLITYFAINNGRNIFN